MERAGVNAEQKRHSHDEVNVSATSRAMWKSNVTAVQLNVSRSSHRRRKGPTTHALMIFSGRSSRKAAVNTFWGLLVHVLSYVGVFACINVLLPTAEFAVDLGS